MPGHAEFLSWPPVLARFRQGANDLGNHVAGTPDDNPVADLQILAPDLVLIVQGGIADRDPADEHRLQARHWCELAGAPDLHLDVEQPGDDFLGGKLVRDGKARRTRGTAQQFLPVEAIHLVDDAVDFVGQLRTPVQQTVMKGEQSLDIIRARALAGHRKTEVQKPLQQRTLGRRQFDPVRLPQRVGKKPQRPLRRDRSIELAQAAGGGIARIDEFVPVGLALARIDAGKILTEQQHFPAHLEHSGGDARQAQRNRAHGAHIGGDILSRRAVSARRRLHEQTPFITQADRQSVIFRFGCPDQLSGRQTRSAQPLAYALIEGAHFGLVQRIAQREHRHPVPDRRKGAGRCAGYPLRRRIGRNQPGMITLDLLQFAKQPIVFGIGHAGRIEHVVFVVEPCDQRTQRGGARRRIRSRSVAGGHSVEYLAGKGRAGRQTDGFEGLVALAELARNLCE